MTNKKIKINRAPVLTLWAAVVAQRLGYEAETALTLGRGLAGLNAQSKGRRLGIFEEKKDEEAEPKSAGRKTAPVMITILGRPIPTVSTPQGVRATVKGAPIDPGAVEKYLKQKFGAELPEVRAALESLAKAYRPQELETAAYSLYERFRPRIPEGAKGWGAAGELDLAYIRSLAKK